MGTNSDLEKYVLPEDCRKALTACDDILNAETADELYTLCCGGMKGGKLDIDYTTEDGTLCREAELVKCRNGLAVNFTEDYMRRRDGDSMSIADSLPSDKPRFKDRYGYDFSVLRERTLKWLSLQRVIVFPFRAGGTAYGTDALLICPENAAFFALALAMMQGRAHISKGKEPFEPRGIIYLAPPFRHSHFAGKQAVVHQRSEGLHEIFAYNLYPGPSAKKGVFSMLLDIGEREGWITNHASAVRSRTAQGEELVFMHEGASGGGKSEMLEPLHRSDEGRVKLGENMISAEEHYLCLKDSCILTPIADDMVTARPQFQKTDGRLSVADGEEGWFLRVDGDKAYGSIPLYERASIHPPKPLMFFNIEAVPDATCLIWEHYRENDGKPCSNPRVIIPRTQLGCEAENRPRAVDVRSFGLRMPPSTAKKPDCGVMAMLQIVPTALAWLWRLTAPRGYNNPSVIGGTAALESEGVGSYWPFCTGQRITQANLLLRQLNSSPNTLNILIPNQHVGAIKTGFAGQWLVREALTRRGGRLRYSELIPAPFALFGYEAAALSIEEQNIPPFLLHPCMQPELGVEGYRAGTKLISEFFAQRLADYLKPGLDALGREIIELCLDNAPLEEYLRLSPPLPLD